MDLQPIANKPIANKLIANKLIANMHIFIMRHGEAELHAASDALRQLTPRGIANSSQAGAWLAAQAYPIQQVLVSPYKRAQQTLSALELTLALPSKQQTLNELTPGGDETQVASYLSALGQQTGINSILLVSHLPLVGNLVAALCPQESAPMFGTSAIAHIVFSTVEQTGDLIDFYRI